jgi:hypothetical protein
MLVAARLFPEDREQAADIEDDDIGGLLLSAPGGIEDIR